MPKRSASGRKLAGELKLLSAILDAIPAVVCVKDLEGRYVLVNRRWETLFHSPRDQVSGKTDYDLFPRETAESFRANDRSALESEAPVEREEMVALDDGPHTFASLRFPVRDAAGQAYAVCGISSDITARKRAEEALHHLEQGFRLTAESVRDHAIYLLDPAGHVASWNAGAARIEGYRAEEILGRHISLFYIEEDVRLGRPEQALRRAAEAGRFEQEAWRVRKDGSRFWASEVLTALRAEDGSHRGFVNITRDMTEPKRLEEGLRRAQGDLEAAVRERTRELAEINRQLEAEIAERRRAEERLQQSEEYYRALSENALDIVTVLEPDGTMRYSSPAVERVLGYAPPELIGKNTFEFIHPEDLPAVRDAIQRAVEHSGGLSSLDFRFRHKDGSWRQLEGFGKGLLDNPAIRGIVVRSRDVTERRRAEAALRENEAVLNRSREKLRALTARLLTGEEEERKRISRELHDDLNQRLAIVAVELGSLARNLPESRQAVRDRIRELERRLAELSEDVRRMAHQLRPSILDDLGLLPALRSYCADFSKREGIEVEFAHRRLPPAVAPDVALCLYRVAQEALRNVAKHSGSRHAWVALAGRGHLIWLSIRDRGVGFDPAAVKGKGGLGIVSMEERVRLARGRISVKSQPGLGAKIVACVPAISIDE